MVRRSPLIVVTFPISVEQFWEIEMAVRAAGYSAALERSEQARPPATSTQFAAEAIYVICNSGMSNAVAVPIFERCMRALRNGKSAATVFGHPAKAQAIDWIWKRRRRLYREFANATDIVSFCEGLPWVGPITKYHLAKNLGADFAKPDVHLNRLAEQEGLTAQQLCERLAKVTGYRTATIDMILWRACADRIIQSKS